MRIRTGTPADLAAVTAAEAVSFPPAEAAGEESFRARLAVYPDHFWLLEDEGRVVAFVDGMATDEPTLRDEMYCRADLHREEGAWQMIFGVVTVPEYRRRGCAAMLLRRAIADARAQGRRGLVLTCKERLTDYYARFGFRDEGVSPSEHGGVVWHQMRLEFSPSPQNGGGAASAGDRL
jgi:GNAT superfamily N-acetyltransferase